MSTDREIAKFVSLDMENSIWEHFYTVAPLVVVGSKENKGFDLAPKHMVTPIGFSRYFGFVCTPRHATYHNIKEHKKFSVSFVRPDQVLLSSLAAMPRCTDPDDPKAIVRHIPSFQSKDDEYIFVEGSYLLLECKLHKIIDGFDDYSMITGTIEEARVHADYLVQSDQSAQEQIYRNPLLVYVAQGRFAEIRETMRYPFPKDFKR